MKGSFHSPEQRCRQLQRVLLLISIVSPLRFGATVEELHHEMVEAYGDVCLRTIRRDLEALEMLGYVERPSELSQGSKWRWVRQQQTEQLVRLSLSMERPSIASVYAHTA